MDVQVGPRRRVRSRVYVNLTLIWFRGGWVLAVHALLWLLLWWVGVTLSNHSICLLHTNLYKVSSPLQLIASL